jgi:MYND finger
VQVDPESSKEGFANPFEVLPMQPQPILPNMHYTSLDLLPCIFVKGDTLEWMGRMNHRSMLSNHEGAEVAAKVDEIEWDSLIGIKLSIANFLNALTNGNGEPVALGLTKDRRSLDIGLFLSKLRLDLHGASFVLDAYFLHQPAIKGSDDPELIDAASNLFSGRLTPEPAIEIWKKIMPAMVERCRTWSHTADCLYEAEGIPRSAGFWEDLEPICECGRGKNLGAFMETEAWRPFAPYVTRVAIGLVFPSNFEATWLINLTDAQRHSLAYRDSKAILERLGGGNQRDEDLKEKEEQKKEGCWKCKGLGGESGLLKCGRCKKAKYCSDKCQRADWQSHKPHCSPPKS